MKIVNAEIVEGLSNDNYHASDFVSNSKISAFLESPEDFFAIYVEKSTPRPEPSPEMRFGSLFDEMCLEGKDASWVILPEGCNAVSSEEHAQMLARFTNMVVAPRYVLNADGHRKGKPYTDWAKSYTGKEIVVQSVYDATAKELDSVVVVNESCPVVSFDEHAQMCKMRDSLRSHDAGNALIFGQGESQVTIRGVDEETGIGLQVRLDRLNQANISDLKTTKSAKPQSFMHSALDYGYHRQKYLYQAMVQALGDERLPFFFVACEKKASCRVNAIVLDDEWDELAAAEIDDALARIKQCQETGFWHEPHYGKVLTIPYPRRMIEIRQLYKV